MFFGESLSNIKRENMLRYVAYGFLYQPWDDLDFQKRCQVDNILRIIEDVFGLQFEDGYNPSARFRAHIWEPMRILYKPLIFYIAMSFLTAIEFVLLVSSGFQRLKYNGFVVWTKDIHPTRQPQRPAHPSPTKDVYEPNTPLFFVHGIGFGLLPYLHFLFKLKRTYKERPILFIEVPSVSQRFSRQVADIDEVAAAISSTIQQLGFQQAQFVGHSYGTFVVSRLCKLYPDMVASICIIDPVCMLCCIPYLLKNFLDDQYTLQEFLCFDVMKSLRVLCARDSGIAQTFCRKFFWHELVLWPGQFPASSMVVLSQRDKLVPYSAVLKQLEKHKCPAKVLTHPSHAHGAFVFDCKWQDVIIKEIANITLQ